MTGTAGSAVAVRAWRPLALVGASWSAHRAGA